MLCMCLPASVGWRIRSVIYAVGFRGISVSSVLCAFPAFARLFMSALTSRIAYTNRLPSVVVSVPNVPFLSHL